MSGNLYVTGYNGTTRYYDKPKGSVAPLVEWSHWKNLDPEFARRALALMDASITAGRPVGIGSVFRTYDGQKGLFLSRHHVVASGGCCSFEGKHYALNAGVAHAAPPGRSYHEATTKAGKALAIDFVGDMRWLHDNAPKYGIFEFCTVNSEPWHGQPVEIPRGRSGYRASVDEPLKPFTLPGAPKPAPTRVYAPKPDIVQGRTNDPAEVRALQHLCNFWGWRDATNRTLLVDGIYAQKSVQACIAMQTALKVKPDGWYGPATQRALQAFLDEMVR